VYFTSCACGFGEPNLLLPFNFYTDSICDKPVQFLDTNNGCGRQDQDQEQLSVGDGSAHGQKYPFIEEFSDFIASVSTSSLKFKLMTFQQRLFAKALWEAENYGGSISKCKAHLKEIYGDFWYQLTSVEDHFTDEREYCEYVLKLDHLKQWDNQQKLAKLQQNLDSDEQ
jgi:hypothetical protein